MQDISQKNKVVGITMASIDRYALLEMETKVNPRHDNQIILNPNQID